jgi:hypothetical protein
MNKSLFSIIGFLMFIIGGIALVLTLVGMRLTILSPLESLGAGIAFIVKLLIMVFGIIIVYLARTTTEEDV